MASDYMTAKELEDLTGTRASTFRYWASLGTTGPASFKIGRRAVPRQQTVQWKALGPV
jgi:prophage regulatory protein